MAEAWSAVARVSKLGIFLFVFVQCWIGEMDVVARKVVQSA